MLFKNRKIKRLIDEFAEARNSKEELRVINELRHFRKPVLRQIAVDIQSRRLKPEKAELLLEKIGDSDCAEEIVSLISIPQARSLAKNVILKRLKRAALPHLVVCLENADLKTRNTAADIVIELGDDACVPILVEKYDLADHSLKRNILKILSKSGSPAARSLIVKSLDDESAHVVVAAVRVVEDMRDPELTPALLEKLSARDPQIKRAVIRALGATGDKRAYQPLLEMIKDQDMRIRQDAVDGILELCDAEIIPDVLNLLGDEDVNVRRCAVEILNKLSDPRAGDALIQAIKDSDWWVRQIATDTLAEMKGEVVIRSFIGLAQENDVNLRRCVVEFFNQVPDPMALDTLIKMLDDEDWWVRDKAVIALGKLKNPKAVAHLEKLIHDEETKGTVPAALAEIGGEQVLGPLMKFLKEDQKRVRLAAIKAFGALRADAAVTELKSLLWDSDEDVRAEASKALKEITGRVYRPEDYQANARPGLQTAGALTEAIVVLDICNSTDITARYGDEFALNLLQRLDEMVIPLAEREQHGFIKSTGDGFLLTFPRVDNSIRFSLDVLKRLYRYNTSSADNSRINLRIAVNLGETRTDDSGDKHGVAINMAFRVEGLKRDDLVLMEGGIKPEDFPLENRILITENVAVEPLLNGLVKPRLVGLFQLKGITGYHKIFQVAPDDQGNDGALEAR